MAASGASRSIPLTTLLLVYFAGISSASRALKASRSLQQSTYTSVKGQDPGGPSDSFAQTAEASTVSQARGLYFNGGKVVVAGEGALPAPISYGYTGNAEAVASLAHSENSQVYGTQAIAMTPLGARASAGSGTAYTATDGVRAISNNRMTYGPGNSIGDHTKSVAFTDRAGTSVAMTGTGNGPVALATGSSVAAFARSEHDKEKDKPVVTIGHREAGDPSAGTGSKWFTRRSLFNI